MRGPCSLGRSGPRSLLGANIQDALQLLSQDALWCFPSPDALQTKVSTGAKLLLPHQNKSYSLRLEAPWWMVLRTIVTSLGTGALWISTAPWTHWWQSFTSCSSWALACGYGVTQGEEWSWSLGWVWPLPASTWSPPCILEPCLWRTLRANLSNLHLPGCSPPFPPRFSTLFHQQSHIGSSAFTCLILSSPKSSTSSNAPIPAAWTLSSIS